MRKTSKIMSTATLAVMCMSVGMGTAMAVQPQQAPAGNNVTMAATATVAQLKAAYEAAKVAYAKAVTNENVANANLVKAKAELARIDANIVVANKARTVASTTVTTKRQDVEKATKAVDSAKRAVDNAVAKKAATVTAGVNATQQLATFNARSTEAKAKLVAVTKVRDAKLAQRNVVAGRYRVALNTYHNAPTPANLAAATAALAKCDLANAALAKANQDVNGANNWIATIAKNIEATKKSIADNAQDQAKATADVTTAQKNLATANTSVDNAAAQLTLATAKLAAANTAVTNATALRSAAAVAVTAANDHVVKTHAATVAAKNAVAVARVKYDSANR